MKICSNCGAQLEDNALFCEECGTKQPEQKKFCAECGTELKPDAKFCMECGTPVGNSDTSNTKKEAYLKFPSQYGDVEVIQTDDNTLSITIKGVSFNLKLVEGPLFAFYLGETPVTQALWSVVMGNNPSNDNSNLEYPVTNLTEMDRMAFLIKLKKLTGVEFVLPDISQWTYAYYGGSKSKGYLYSGSNSKVGWFDEKLHPVAQLYPNELGIYDMDGNVRENLDNSYTYYDYEDFDQQIYHKYDYEFPGSLEGIRIAINLKTYDDIVKPNNILEAIISNYQNKLESINQNILAEKLKKINLCKTEREKELIDFQYNGGILYYDKNENIKTLLPTLFGEEYQEFEKKVNELLGHANKLSKSNTSTWRMFGEKVGNPQQNPTSIIEYYILNKETLILRGKGSIPNLKWYDEDRWCLNKEIRNICHNIKNLIILNGICKITKFKDFKSLRLVVLPNTVEEIPSVAFSGCALQYIKLSDNLKKIGRSAFSNTRISNLYLPIKIEKIEELAFFKCHSLNKVVLPDSVILEDDVFYGDDLLNIN